MKVIKTINITQHTTQQIEEAEKKGFKLNISSICEEAIKAELDRLNPIKTEDTAESDKQLEHKISEIIDAAALHILLGNPQDKFVSRKLHDEAFVYAAKRLLELDIPDNMRISSDDLKHRISWEYTRLKPSKNKMEGETNEAEKK